MNWQTWAANEVKRPQWDKRVQAIRCTCCHRLRLHPRKSDSRTWFCPCGGAGFIDTFPHPDEEQLAIRLYSREIEERNLYAPIVQQLIATGGR